MGAESSVLQDCEIGEVVPQQGNVNWDLHDAVSSDGQDVSIFVYKKKEKRDLDLLKLNAQHLKTLRHPHILHYMASGQNSDGSYLMTERVVPLDVVLSSLTLEEIICGVHDVLEALIFLHDTVKVCHNNVNLAALYVSKDGRWRLGGFEHACHFKDVSREFLDLHLAFRSENSIAPEEKDSSYVTGPGQDHCRDVYAFGGLADFILELLGDVGDVTKTFELIVQDECLSPDPSSRPQLRSLRDNRMFRNDFMEIQAFLKHIPLKSKQEKEDFFRSVIPKLIGLPEQLVARQLVKPLLSRFVLLDKAATVYMVPHLLTPCRDEVRPAVFRKGELTPVLTEPVFRSHVIPELFKIFHVHDTAIRIILLNNFSSFADMFDRNCLKATILPQILLGVADSDDQLVAASLRGLADLVLILGGESVIGGRSKQIFTAGTPKDVNDRLKDLTDLKSVRQSLGKQHRILLKDLASGRRSNINGDLHQTNGCHGDNLEVEASKRDKERRREEARQRREEKRRLLREKKLSLETAKAEQANHIVKGWSDEETDPSTTSPYQSIHTSPLSRGRVPQGEVTDHDQPEEWESWEDSNMERSKLEESDGNISDQIEDELQKMPSTISPKSSRSLSDTERSPLGKMDSHHSEFDSSMARQDDQEPWQDMETRVKSSRIITNKALRLSKKQAQHSRVESSESSWDVFPVSSEKPKQHHGFPSSKSPTSPRSSRPLGAEFDIMEIEVKKISHAQEPEPDFFSDMIPEIKTQVSLDPLMPVLPHSSRTADNGKGSDYAKPSLSFAVTADSTMEADGWGEEELTWDWDTTLE